MPRLSAPKALLAALALVVAGCASAPTAPELTASSRAAPDAWRDPRFDAAMLASADPVRAVAYFKAAVERDNSDPELRRKLARAYALAGRIEEARAEYDFLVERGQALEDDLLERALLAARAGDWEGAATAASDFPPALDSPRRVRIDAVVADRAGDWARADAAHARAVAEDPNPAAALNNWAVSHMARGDAAGALELFERAILADPDLFTVRNNAAIAEASLGNYSLPPTPLPDAERAILLNNMGVAALRRGDRAAARRLLAEAVAIHPRHYAAAAERLRVLGKPLS